MGCGREVLCCEVPGREIRNAWSIRREAEAVKMLGSLAVFVEKGHHVDAGPHHEDHKEEISNHHDIQKCH